METLLIVVISLGLGSAMFYFGYRLGKQVAGEQHPLPPIVDLLAHTNSLPDPNVDLLAHTNSLPDPNEKTDHDHTKFITGQQMANTGRYQKTDGMLRFLRQGGQFVQQKAPKKKEEAKK